MIAGTRRQPTFTSAARRHVFTRIAKVDPQLSLKTEGIVTCGVATRFASIGSASRRLILSFGQRVYPEQPI